MAVSKKNRRRIFVDGREYLWRVKKKKGPRLEVIDPIDRKKYMSGRLVGPNEESLSDDVRKIISLGAVVRLMEPEQVCVSITPKIVRHIISSFPNFAPTS